MEYWGVNSIGSYFKPKPWRKPVMQRELLDQLISAIGARIEGLGEDLQDSKFTGLAQRLEELRTLIASAEAAERMRGI